MNKSMYFLQFIILIASYYYQRLYYFKIEYDFMVIY